MLYCRNFMLHIGIAVWQLFNLILSPIVGVLFVRLGVTGQTYGLYSKLFSCMEHAMCLDVSDFLSRSQVTEKAKHEVEKTQVDSESALTFIKPSL